MKVHRIIISVFAVIGISVLTTSCSDFLKEYSQDLAKVESWEDLDELLLGEGYLPSSMYNTGTSASSISNSGEYHANLDLLHFMGDELREYYTDTYCDRFGHRTSMFPYFTWQQDMRINQDGRVAYDDSRYWADLYARINTANMVISQIDEMPVLHADDPLQIARVKGEALFLRAAYYFVLANLYAEPYAPATAEQKPGIPVKASEYIEDRDYDRGTLAETYQRILNDLEEAASLLEGKTRRSIYHANYTAARLLQSRVCLYMQNWQEAARYAQQVIDLQPTLLNLHNLQPGDEALTGDSPETIFSMGGYMAAYEFADYWSRQTGERSPAWFISDDMMQLFGDDDLRSTLYVGSSEYEFYPVLTKVNGQSSAFGRYTEVSDCFLLRTPEAYLTLAEASVLSGDISTAQRTLQTFLATRMNATVTLPNSAEEMISLIRDERAREFLLEGHRWFDLRRYTVSNPYPYSKIIEHAHVYYQGGRPFYADHYQLGQNDKAYTLPIPRTVYNFQVTLGQNERPERRPVTVEDLQ